MCDDSRVDPHDVASQGDDPGTAPSRAGARPWVHVAICLGLLALTLVLYAPDLDLGWFRIDDEPYVPHNERIQAVTLDNVTWIATQPYFANYSPLHLYSYMADWAFAGENPRAFHLSNNVWAGLCAIWVYVLGVYLTRRTSIGLLAGLLFVVHPAHVEAIAWVSSRKDLVSTFFAIPCLIAYLEGRRRPSRGAYGLSVVLYLLAVAGKLSVIVLPGVMLLFDLFVERRRGLALLLDKLPYGLVAVFFALRVMDAQPPPFRELDPVGLTAVLGQFLWLLTGLGEYVVFRPLPGTSGGPPVWPWLLLAASAIVLPLAFARRLPVRASMLVGWIFLALVPSQILRFAYPVSDRYLFFPSVPFVVLIAYAAVGSTPGLRRRVGVLCATVLGLVWAWASAAYLAEWSDPRSVWYGASKKVEDVYVHQFLGEHYQTSAERLLSELATRGEPSAASLALASELGFDPSTGATLREEWSRSEGRRPLTERVTGELLARAHDKLQQAAAYPADRINVELHFNLARNRELSGDDAAALAAYQRAWDEAANHPQDRVRYPYQALSSCGLSGVAERAGDARQALALMRRAQDEEARGGQSVLSNVEAEIRRLEALTGE